MALCHVTFLPDNQRVSVEEGTTLFAAAAAAQVSLTGSCGGQGVCGRCLMRVVSGNVNCDPDHGSDSSRPVGLVRACLAQVEGDSIVEVPEQSRLASARVLLERGAGELVGEEAIGEMAELGGSPLCRSVTVDVDPPTLDDNASDLDRFRGALKRELGRQAEVDFSVLRKLAACLREEWKVTATVLELPPDRLEIIDVEPASKAGKCCGLAVDIGTTTVAAHLVDLNSGRLLGKAGTQNLQARFGDDVIARMVYAEEENGLAALQASVVESVNELIGTLTLEQDLKPDEVKLVMAAGNTVMTQMLLGLDTRHIRREPYVPTASSFPAVTASELGLALLPRARVLTFPAVASYVGGDIVAGVLVNGQAKAEELVLYIDIGTNGEIVLGNRDWLVTCACSAGPAFEGGGITHGMRAVEGAIEGVAVDLVHDTVKLDTVGGKKPAGICGSGLIACIAEFLRAGVIDRTGRIYADARGRVRENDGEKEFVLARGGETKNGTDIVLTENDIQNVLRAKGAVFAGIRSLLKSVGLEMGAIDRVIIAGGFGSYINIGDAVRIGLLPDLPLEKYHFIGNAAVKGANLAANSAAAYSKAAELAGRMTYIELSVGTLFMDEFVSALFFPHTDLDLFPSLNA